MAKLIHIIDSNDFIAIEGYQYCRYCPLEDFENAKGDCRIHFKFLFGKSCNEMKVTLKPTAKKNEYRTNCRKYSNKVTK